MHSSKNPGLDLVRAIAISLVLVAHASTFFNHLTGALGSFFLFGIVGVELFFALSGYLIGGILLRYSAQVGPGKWLGVFMMRRWLRTLPNYFVFLGLNVAFFSWQLGHPPPNLFRYLLFTQSFTHYPDGLVFGESWSLCVEEWFYVSFPLAFCAVHWAGGSRLQQVLIPVTFFIVGGFVLRVVGVVWLLHPWNPDLAKSVIFRLDAIIYGILFRWLHEQHPRLTACRLLPVCGGAVLVTTFAWLLQFGSERPDALTAVISLTVLPLACAALLPWFTRWDSDRSSVFWRWAGRMAAWSYSLYLCNMLVYFVLIHFWPQPGWSLAWGLMGLFLVLSVGTAAVAHAWVEAPLMRWRNRRFPDPKFVPPMP